MLIRNKNSFLLFLGGLLFGIILLNLTARDIFKRFDLTDNKMFSLSPSSENIVKNLDEFGFSAKEISFDISKVVKRSRNVAKQLSNGVEHLLKKNKVELLNGFGKILDKNGHLRNFEV